MKKLTVYYTIRNVDPHFKVNNLNEAFKRLKKIEQQLSMFDTFDFDTLDDVYCINFNTLECWEYTSKEIKKRFIKSNIENAFNTYWNEFSKKEFEKIAKRLKIKWNSLKRNQAYNLLPKLVDRLDKIDFWQNFKFSPFLYYGKFYR